MTAAQVHGYCQELFGRRNLDLAVWWSRRDEYLEAVPRQLARTEPRKVIARGEYLAEYPGP